MCASSSCDKRADPGVHTRAVTIRPRFSQVDRNAGHYESLYLTVNHPAEPLAMWIRFTVRKPPGRQATGAIWFTLFEPGGPTAVKVTTPDPRSTDIDLLAVGSAGSIRRDGTAGSVSAHGIDVTWDLRFTTIAEELRHLPYEWMYRTSVPRTKSTSPYPSMRVSGTVGLAGRTFVLNDWLGMLGHNWGREHAHRWIWLRGAAFAEDREAWLDVVLGRIKVGPLVLPWVANGVLAIDGVRHRVGGLRNRVSVHEERDGCALVLPGRGVSLAVHVAAPLAMSVAWNYADPAGGQRQVRNCSVAGLQVSAQWRDRTTDAGLVRLTTAHGGVYELGSTDFDPTVPVQPYSDG